MAEGLGDIASLLGHSMSQAAQRGEEQDRKSRKKAMKDQLLMSLAAPIVTGLGKGVVDFAGDVVLGSDSKDFFSTREGRTMTKRLNDTAKASKSISDQITQLRKVGVAAGGTGDIYEGVYQSNRNAIIDKKTREFGTVEGSAAQIEAAMVSIDSELREQSNREADELLDFQRQLSFGSDLSNQELLARYKASPIGKGRGRKFAGKIASFFTGKDYQKDVVEVAADGLITGGDLEIQNSEWFKMFKSGGFQKELADKLRAAQDIRGNLFDEQDQQNVLAQLTAENQELFSQLNLSKEIDTEELQNKTIIQIAQRKHPRIAESVAKTKKIYGKDFSSQNLMTVISSEYKTIDADEVESYVSRYIATNSDKADKVKQAFSSKITGSNDPFSSASPQDQEAALEATDLFITQITGSFNFSMRNKIENIRNTSNMDDFEKFQRISELQTSGGVQLLANEFINTYIDGLPIIPVGKGAMRGGSLNKLLEASLNGAPTTLRNSVSPELQEELDAVIDRAFGDVDSNVQREKQATSEGLNRRRDRTERSGGDVYTVDPKFLNQVENSITSIMNDSTLSKQERKEKALTRLTIVTDSVEANFNSLGFSKIDPSYEADRNKLLEIINGSSTVVPSSQVSRTNFDRTSAF
jgi:hypothetical protein